MRIPSEAHAIDANKDNSPTSKKETQPPSSDGPTCSDALPVPLSVAEVTPDSIPYKEQNAVAQDTTELKSVVKRRHVSFVEESRGEDDALPGNFHESSKGRMPSQASMHHRKIPSPRYSHARTTQHNHTAPSALIKMKEYTPGYPGVLSKAFGKMKSAFSKSSVSAEERQKRTHLLSAQAVVHPSAADDDPYAAHSPAAQAAQLSRVSDMSLPAATSGKFSGTTVPRLLAESNITRTPPTPSIAGPAMSATDSSSPHPAGGNLKAVKLHRTEWSIPPSGLRVPSTLSRENLSAFDQKHKSRSSGQKRDHSVACALINILGGIILGYADIGVNTALSVLYPCALHMVPEHNFMWWVAGLLSIVNIGAAIGALLGGYAAERYGRKWSMAAGGVFALAPIMTMFVRGFSLQVLSRVITGVGVGFTSSICGTYVSEMAPAKRRGFLNSFFEVSINTGILVANIVTYFVLGIHRDMEIDAYCVTLGSHPEARAAESYQMIWSIMLGAVVVAGVFLALVLSPLVPESAVWLAKRNRCGKESHQDSVYSRSNVPNTPIGYGQSVFKDEDALPSPFGSSQLKHHADSIPRARAHHHFDEQSLTMISVGWASTFNSGNDSIEERDAALRDFPLDSSAFDTKPCAVPPPSYSIDDSIKPYDFSRVYTAPSAIRKIFRARKPIAIAIMDAVALQLTGMYALMFYCHKFLEVGHINQKMLGTLGIMAWNWASTFISLALVERVGRRKLLIPSMFILTLTIISMPMAIIYGKGATHGVFFLFLLLCMYIAAYEVGPGVLFWVICAEVFPHDIAQMGFAFVNSLQWVLMVFVTFLFPPLQKHLGGWVFAVFFLPSLISTIFFYFCLPETKGRSRRDVAKELSGGKWCVQKRKLW